MPLSEGARLGAYEVVGLLGQGGMGEVYRAIDTKLGRSVAIKVLPDALAFDQDRVARLEREARVLASLNHTNIASLYGMEEADGRHFLLMELVEGETLADLLKRGALPVERALPIARQIAEALEAAHDKGIVHRDLKPANVKITPDDKVKVLDFGLAKAMVAEDQSIPSSTGTIAATQSPTLSILSTQAGIILGTAAYMSPEQAQGLRVDARSDVFSFGAVLYEMLTGRQPFQGDTVPAVMASVLVSEADFSSLPRDVNPRIGELVRRCLEKNPKRRWQAVGDLRAELEIVSTAPRAALVSAGHVQQSLWQRGVPLALTALLATAITSFAWWTFRPLPPPMPVGRFIIPLPATSAVGGLGQSVAISLDGRQVAFFSGGSLYVRPLSLSEPKLIGANGAFPVFSPDGTSIAFFSTDEGGSIKRVASTGGPAVTLCRVQQPFHGLSWTAGGIVYGENGRRVMRVSPDGGTPENLLTVKDDESAWGPQILPGADHVLFTLADAATPPLWDKARIAVQSLATGERIVLMEGGSDARYLITGHIVYAVAGVLFARPFDPVALRVTGGPVPVVEGIQRGSSTGTGTLVGIGGASTHFGVSDTGTLVYVPGPSSASAVQQRLALGDRNGGIEPLKLPAGMYQFPRSSPDGKQIVFGTDDGTDAAIWVYELAGTSPMRQLTFEGRNRYPVWSGDGQSIAYQSDREGDLAIFRQRVDGSAARAERVTKPEPAASHVPESWSKGDVLAFNITKGTDVTLATVSLTDKKVSIISELVSSIWPDAVFSPDGKWIAYAARRAAQRDNTLYVEPFPPTGERHLITGAQHFPAWSPDGRELFFIAPQFRTTPGRVGFASVYVSTTSGFRFGNLTPVDRRFNVTGAAIGRRRTYDVLPPDGRRFIGVIDAESRTDSTSNAELHVVTNWFEELRQKVPIP